MAQRRLPRVEEVARLALGAVEGVAAALARLALGAVAWVAAAAAWSLIGQGLIGQGLDLTRLRKQQLAACIYSQLCTCNGNQKQTETQHVYEK